MPYGNSKWKNVLAAQNHSSHRIFTNSIAVFPGMIPEESLEPAKNHSMWFIWFAYCSRRCAGFSRIGREMNYMHINPCEISRHCMNSKRMMSFFVRFGSFRKSQEMSRNSEWFGCCSCNNEKLHTELCVDHSSLVQFARMPHKRMRKGQIISFSGIPGKNHRNPRRTTWFAYCSRRCAGFSRIGREVNYMHINPYGISHRCMNKSRIAHNFQKIPKRNETTRNDTRRNETNEKWHDSPVTHPLYRKIGQIYLYSTCMYSISLSFQFGCVWSPLLDA
jgi:hypothetical protein